MSSASRTKGDWLVAWDPEDEKTWDKKLAWSTLTVTTFTLTLCFVAWFLPSAIVPVREVPVRISIPRIEGLNFVGGIKLSPNFAAILIGLTVYTGAFIAEIVRSGITSVSHGQTEAARSLGLRPGPTLRKVIIPQALRVIIPPLTSQYLNLVKNSSLAAGIGYPEMVSLFAGTVLNQTGQAIEVIAITMSVYLAISISISLLMNWYNTRIALIER